MYTQIYINILICYILKPSQFPDWLGEADLGLKHTKIFHQRTRWFKIILTYSTFCSQVTRKHRGQSQSYGTQENGLRAWGGAPLLPALPQNGGHRLRAAAAGTAAAPPEGRDAGPRWPLQRRGARPTSRSPPRLCIDTGSAVRPLRRRLPRWWVGEPGGGGRSLGRAAVRRPELSPASPPAITRAGASEWLVSLISHSRLLASAHVTIIAVTPEGGGAGGEAEVRIGARGWKWRRQGPSGGRACVSSVPRHFHVREVGAPGWPRLGLAVFCF